MVHQGNQQQTTANRSSGICRADNLMQKAVSENVFPGAVLLVSRNGSILLHNAYGVADLFTRRAVTRETIFDLASLTKPLTTSLAVMVLIQQGKIRLDQKLGKLLPAFKGDEKSQITVRQLLAHNSGLADYKPFYKTIGQMPAEKRKQALRNLLVREPLIHPVGEETLYSDLGFMILEWMVEHVSGKRLDLFVAEFIYAPLGIENLFFVDLNDPKKRGQFAATEKCPWREILLDGQVHDENAYAVGGIEGHAGLFGTATAVHQLLMPLLSAYHGDSPENRFQTEQVRAFFRRSPGSDKALGFDTPALKDSSAGSLFSKNSVGHLGFTGTSFWMDLDRRIIVILLTNRVHPTRDNQAIRAFRPNLHDAVMKSILGGASIKQQKFYSHC